MKSFVMAAALLAATALSPAFGALSPNTESLAGTAVPSAVLLLGIELPAR